MSMAEATNTNSFSAGKKRYGEKVTKLALLASSAVAVLVTVGIVFSLVVESIRFFAEVNFFDFLLARCFVIGLPVPGNLG